MPENRPGRVVYLTNGSGDAYEHGDPVAEDNFVGVAIKQKATGWDSTIADQSQIEDGEDYALIVKGKVLVDNVSGFAKGDPVYIDGSNVLSETASGNTKFGVVTEPPDERGTPAGKCWIDLDLKDSF